MYQLYALLVVVAVCLATGTAAAQIPEMVKIGGIFEVSGSWSSEGEQAKTAAEFAIDDFNEYLRSLGAGWSMSMQVEDAQGNPVVVQDKIQSLHGIGVDMIIGMAFSSHIQQSKSYIDRTGIIVISHAAQSENLAIDDSVFRLVPHDGNQTPAVAAVINDAGIEVLVTVNRADTWGDGLRSGVVSHFDGEAKELIRYDTVATDFSVSVSLLDSELQELINEHGADKIGVLYVGNDEFLTMIQQMKFYENVQKVRWFSTNTQANAEYFVDDPVAREFASQTEFTVTRYIKSADNEVRERLDERFVEKYGFGASPYGYAAYDSVWLLGSAILQTQSTDTRTLAAAIPVVAERTLGAVGLLALTDAGDLATFAFEAWQMTDNGWTKIGDYQSGSIIKDGAASDAAQMLGEAGAVPDWVRNNAEWWADGLIDDQTFLRAIQYLIKEGILVVGSE